MVNALSAEPNARIITSSEALLSKRLLIRDGMFSGRAD
jgi:hypothetical protein